MFLTQRVQSFLFKMFENIFRSQRRLAQQRKLVCL